jgi:hypothetical protein
LIGHALLRVECVEPHQVRLVPEGKLTAETRARPLERLGRIGARARLAEAAGHVREQVRLGIGREGCDGGCGGRRGRGGRRRGARSRQRRAEHREPEDRSDEHEGTGTRDQREPIGTGARARGRRRWTCDHRVQRQRLRDALELAAAAGVEVDGQRGARQPPHRVRHEQLASAGLTADASSDVDRRADVALVGLDRLARVDADPDADRATVRPGCRGAIEDREPALHGAAGRGEDDVEAVAFGLDLGAAEAADDVADERPVRLEERRCRLIAVGLDVSRVVAEVGEQESVRSGRAGDRHGQSRSPRCGDVARW